MFRWGGRCHKRQIRHVSTTSFTNLPTRGGQPPFASNRHIVFAGEWYRRTCNFLSTALIVCTSLEFFKTDNALLKSQLDQSMPWRPSVSACVSASLVTTLFLVGAEAPCVEELGATGGEVEEVDVPIDTDEDAACGSGGASSRGTPWSSRSMSCSPGCPGGGAGGGAGRRRSDLDRSR